MGVTVRSLPVSSLPRPAIRRSISIPVILVLAAATIVVTPVLVVLLYLADLAQRNPRGRLSRLWMLVVSSLWVETVGMLGCTWLWIRHLGGRDPERWLAVNYRLEFWWCNSHLDNFRRWANVRINYPDPDDTEIGGAIVIARHASHVDALVPLQYVGTVAERFPNYTLKQELQWAPAMDLVGNRTPQVWLDRAPEPGSPQFAAMEALAAGIDETVAAIIFPEGTFFTAERRDRAADRIGQSRPDLAEKARRLRYILPPRPAGTLILLRGAPSADVVFMANVGLEHFGSLKEIMANIAAPKTIDVAIWRHERSTVPESDHDVNTWLLDRWLEMDEWIHANLHARQALEDSK